MAKYSTGGSLGSGGDSCELCGESSKKLRTANVAGAQLEVCSDCASHGDTNHTDEKREERTTDQDRKRKAAQNTAQMSDRASGDSTHWEREGTNYEDDRLPYLVSDYGSVVEQARQEEGLQLSELAAELDVPETDLLAIEQGRANGAGIGGSVIEALEERLDVALSESA